MTEVSCEVTTLPSAATAGILLRPSATPSRKGTSANLSACARTFDGVVFITSNVRPINFFGMPPGVIASAPSAQAINAAPMSFFMFSGLLPGCQGGGFSDVRIYYSTDSYAAQEKTRHYKHKRADAFHD